jgi:hypothetical protein
MSDGEASSSSSSDAEDEECAAAEVSDDEGIEQQDWLQEQPCEVCGDARGNHIICDYCLRCWHLGCLQPVLQAAPAGMWLCGACDEAGHGAATAEALGYHARWVQSTFPGNRTVYWGQLSYSSMATLAIKYSDGEGYDGATVAEVEGRVPLTGDLAQHRSLQLQAEGVVVPQRVLKKFAAQKWLVVAESEGT